jgi:hypothetical protein
MQLAVQLAVQTVVQPAVQQSLPCNSTPSVKKQVPSIVEPAQLQLCGLHKPHEFRAQLRNAPHHKTAADRQPVLHRWPQAKWQQASSASCSLAGCTQAAKPLPATTLFDR